VLRGIFEPKSEEVTGGCRTLNNEALHNLYSSPSTFRMIKSRIVRWEGYVARMGAKIIAFKILVGESDAKKPLGRLRYRWEDDIKMDR
jgi:hypothetical protein